MYFHCILKFSKRVAGEPRTQALLSEGWVPPDSTPKQRFPGPCRSGCNPLSWGDSFSPDRAARRQDKNGGPSWAPRSEVECCLNRTPRSHRARRSHVTHLLPPLAKGSRPPYLLWHLPLLRVSRPSYPPPHPKHAGGLLQRRFGRKRLSGYFSRGINPNLQGSLPIPVLPSLPRRRRACRSPASTRFLPLNADPGKPEAPAGAAGKRNSGLSGWRPRILGVQEVGGARVFLSHSVWVSWIPSKLTFARDPNIHPHLPAGPNQEELPHLLPQIPPLRKKKKIIGYSAYK